MQTYRLRHRDHTTLFEGDYRTLRECIEDALQMGISLDGVSFRNLDLSEINLDGTEISEGDFTGANLTGANISEATLHHCLFSDASLYNTCFAKTDLSGSLFHNANFGGTDLAGATLDYCVFGGSSALSLNFSACDSMQGTWYDAHNQHCGMSRPPLVILGAAEQIAAFDHHVMIGQRIFTTHGPAWQECPLHGSRVLPRLPQDTYKAINLLDNLRAPVCGAAIVERTKSTKS